MKTSHPRAKAVAYEMGVQICDLNPERTLHEIDCSEADFNEMLEMMGEPSEHELKNFNRKAYNSLQNEGHEEKEFIDRTPSNKNDY